MLPLAVPSTAAAWLPAPPISLLTIRVCDSLFNQLYRRFSGSPVVAKGSADDQQQTVPVPVATQAAKLSKLDRVGPQAHRRPGRTGSRDPPGGGGEGEDASLIVHASVPVAMDTSVLQQEPHRPLEDQPQAATGSPLKSPVSSPSVPL